MTECELPNCDTDTTDRKTIWIAFTAMGATTGGDVQFRVCPSCYTALRSNDKQTTRQGVRDTLSEE